MNRNLASRLLLIFILFLFTASSFQNCAQQVEFGKLTQQISERSLIVTPKSTTTERSVKVLFVVDDSYTMSQSQQKLSDAVDSLIDGMQDLPIEVSAITTTYSQQKSQTELLSTSMNGKIKTELRQYHPRKLFTAPIKLDPKDTPARRTQLKNEIKEKIKSAGVGGDDEERPICAVAAEMLSQNSFLKQGDAGTIIFLTDEDDRHSNGCNIIGTYSGPQRFSYGSPARSHDNLYFKGLSVEYRWYYKKDGVTIEATGHAKILLSPFKNVSCNDKAILYQAALSDDKYNSHNTHDGYVGPTPADILSCEPTVISLGSNTHIDYPANSELGQYLYTHYGLPSYFAGVIYGAKPPEVDNEVWSKTNYCDKKFKFPKETTQYYTAVEYLQKIGFSMATGSNGTSCYSWKSEGSDGTYYWDLELDNSKNISMQKYLNEFLKTSGLDLNSAVKKLIEVNYGLNNIVTAGIYKTRGSAVAQGQSYGYNLENFIKNLNGESSSIDLTKYDAAMSRIRELIYQRIVGKRISLNFNPNTEYLKHLYLVNNKGEVLKELVINTDFELRSSEISFTGFEPKPEDQFKAVVETIKIEDF